MITLLLCVVLVAYLLDRASRIHWGSKDGGPESRVHMWGFESKRWFSVLVLRFGPGSREAYHSHAFDSVSWVLAGALLERLLEGPSHWYSASPIPVVTRRTYVHKVIGYDSANWVLTFRGPWSNTWCEVVDDKLVRLTHGRKVVSL